VVMKGAAICTERISIRTVGVDFVRITQTIHVGFARFIRIN